eukprot:SAG11_NODE_4947_length_1712_cov_3.743335_3_plen_81_part_00
MGVDAWVTAELRRQIEAHDERLKGIATYAACDGAAVGDLGHRLSRQLYLFFRFFSTLSRAPKVLLGQCHKTSPFLRARQS